MTTTKIRILLTSALLLCAAPAFAHHAMGGETPTTLGQGFLSGLAHPVIGPDHLVFVLGIGILAAFVPRGWVLPIAFLGMGAVGAGLHVKGVTLPATELLIGLSIVLMAAAVYARRLTTATVVAPLCGLGGFVHGYALAESIVGAEATPLWAYFVGLVIVQAAISLAVREGTLRLVASRPAIAERAMVAASVAILAVGLASQLWPA